jgi:cadmium resistance protein CadD (predicted permease)
MGHILSLIGIATAAFISTNIDDFVMLIAIFADPTWRANQIVAGQFAGMIALIAVSLAGSLLAIIVPAGWLGLLGLLPIAIGLDRLLRNRATLDRPLATSGDRSGSGFIAVALMTVSNGGDNLSLYIPLFSIHAIGDVGLFCVVFLLLTALWCVIAHAMVRRRHLAPPMPRWTQAILPYAMIALGGYILAKTDALALVLRPLLRFLPA